MRFQADRLKPILRVALGFIACVVSALLFTPPARGQEPDDNKRQTQIPREVHATVEIGGQVRDIQGGHTAKFQETRAVPNSFFIQKLRFDFNSADSPYFLAMKGFEILQLDERFTVEAGRFGKYRSQFVWDRIPHSFGDGQSFLRYTSPGLYQVRPSLRASLQAVTLSDSGRTPPNAALPTLVRQELAKADSPLLHRRVGRSQSARFNRRESPSLR